MAWIQNDESQSGEMTKWRLLQNGEMTKWQMLQNGEIKKQRKII